MTDDTTRPAHIAYQLDGAITVITPDGQEAEISKELPRAEADRQIAEVIAAHAAAQEGGA